MADVRTLYVDNMEKKTPNDNGKETNIQHLSSFLDSFILPQRISNIRHNNE